MNTSYNHPDLKKRRQELRKNATPAEKILWRNLRRNGLGAKFIRQYGVASYILDFFCPSKRIAIELDGAQHQETENKLYDLARTKLLESQDIRVLRFPNEAVLKNIQQVCDTIRDEINLKP